jgi:hypothetical protein
MILKIKNHLSVIWSLLSASSIDLAWPSRYQSAPCHQIKDISFELITLFTRRRELMYQLSVLTAVGSGLLLSSAVNNGVTHFGFDNTSILALFLGVSSVTFCLRFIQLYLGILFHGIRFALIEAKNRGENDPISSIRVKNSCKINLQGVSFSVILFFSILSSLCFAVAVRSFFDMNFVPYIVFIFVFLFIMNRTFTGHAIVANRTIEDSINFISNCDCSKDEDLRNHYQLSLAATHSDMICISAIAAAQTISIFGFIGLLDDRIATGLPVSRFGPSIIAAISMLLGLIAVMMYSRLEVAVREFCLSLNISLDKLFWSSMSDIGLGYVVTISFASMNFAFFLFLFFDQFQGKYVNEELRDWISLMLGVTLFIFLLFRRFSRSLRESVTINKP